jgi:hypothetical protein
MAKSDNIAEANVKDWQRRKAEPDYVPPEPVDNYGKPDYLLEEIKKLIEQAYSVSSEEQQDSLLERAKTLELQMVISYENDNLPLLAKSTQEYIQQFKNEVIARQGREK